MPSVISGLEYDIFISYRQKDNKGDRWVSQFVNALKTELDSTFKETISIYFDENPHDGLLETHHVEESLKSKLRCAVFIPIISHTYCDTQSYAWQKEFCVFNAQALNDSFGREIKLANGNVASRILPVKIHDIDRIDQSTFESEVKSVMRAIDFTFKSAGVNRPLTPGDKREDNFNKTFYRDQVNKVANSIREIITALKNPTITKSEITGETQEIKTPKKSSIKLLVPVIIMVLISGYLLYKRNVSEEKTSPSAAHSEKMQSIAVLPFSNLSSDSEQQYFSDGLTDEIITALSGLPSLKVIGRTSSYQFKDKNLDLREIGKQLGVTTLLEGSVRKADGNIRINVNLVDATDGSGIWASSYDLKKEDILKIQNEIARAIVSKLRVTYLDKQFTDVRAINVEAYDFYLKGKEAWTARKIKESETYFTKSIQADSLFSPAYTGLAGACMLAPLFHLGTPNEYYPKASAAAEKSLAIDSLSAIPLLALAITNDYYLLDPNKASSYFQKAISKNSYFAPLHYFYGQHLIRFEKNLKKAEEEMLKSVELEPLESTPHANLGYAWMMSGKFDKAIESLKKSIDLNENNENAWLYLGHCYLESGNNKDAVNSYLKAAELSSDRAKAALVRYFVKNGKTQEAKKWYDDLLEQSKNEYVSNVTLAAAASYLNNKEDAHELYKKAFELKDSWLVTPNLDYPRTMPDDLLSDPRNLELIKTNIPGIKI